MDVDEILTFPSKLFSMVVVSGVEVTLPMNRLSFRLLTKYVRKL
jgi:hypothetical protein